MQVPGVFIVFMTFSFCTKKYHRIQKVKDGTYYVRVSWSWSWSWLHVTYIIHVCIMVCCCFLCLKYLLKIITIAHTYWRLSAFVRDSRCYIIILVQ